MSEENMKTVRRLLEEVWNEGNLSLISELLSPDYVGHVTASEAIHGPAHYQQLAAMYQGVFLDIRFTVKDQFASGDKVATRWTVRVTEDSEAAQHDMATGEPITVPGISIYRFADGKLVESWDTWDSLRLLQSSSAPNIVERLSLTL